MAEKFSVSISRVPTVLRMTVVPEARNACAVPATGAVYKEQMEFLHEGFGAKVTPPVRRSSIVDEAYTNYLPVPLYGYRAKEVTQDYWKVITHMKGQGMFHAAVNA